MSSRNMPKKFKGGGNSRQIEARERKKATKNAKDAAARKAVSQLMFLVIVYI